MLRTLLVAAALIGTAGCTTTPVKFEITDSSRSDAYVELSYKESGFKLVAGDPNQAQQLATARCQLWGYRGAQSYGGANRECMPGFVEACTVTIEYECTR